MILLAVIDPWAGQGLILPGPDGEPTLYRRAPYGVWAAWRAHRARPKDVQVRAIHRRHHTIVASEHSIEPLVLGGER